MSRKGDGGRSTDRSKSNLLERLEEEFEEGEAWTPPRTSTIISICFSGGKIASAVYDQANTTIRLLRDVGEECHFPVLTSLLEQVKPTVIIANRGQDVSIINFLSKACGLTLAEDEDMTTTLDETMRKDDNSLCENTRYVPPKSLSNHPDGQIMNQVEEDDETVNEDGVLKWVVEQNEKRENKRLGSKAPSEQSKGSFKKKSLNDDEIEDDEEEEDEGLIHGLNATLHFMSNVAFNCEKALARVSELFSSEALSECENDLITRFRIDTMAVNMVRSLGALLMYMDSSRTGVEFDLPSARTPITAIKTLLVQEMVEMDALTFRALGIFALDHGTDVIVRNAEHAKTINKNRFSLFGLCCKCRSAPGKRMLRNWFERPTRDETTLKNRLDAIAFLTSEANQDIVNFLHRNLQPIRSLKTIMKRLRASNMKCSDWFGLHSTVFHLRSIGQLIRSGRFSLNILTEFIPFFDDRLAEVCNVVTALIDYSESRVENRMVVCKGVDADLDLLKDIYRELPQRLTNVARSEAKRLGAVRSCAVGYVPMVGYLLQLPAEFNCDHYEDIQFIYDDGEFIHVKSDRMRLLDEEIGDIKMQIIDRETTIMLRLEHQLIARSSLLLDCVRATSVIDCCLSMAKTAKLYGWCRPHIVNESRIHASKIVHPLAHLTVEKSFVPNDIQSGGKDTKVKIFTGPNACGKSVYLKQIGILCYLAHIGSFVPAFQAEIGLVSGILTRMYTVDGVLDGMSTFAKDLSQLSIALRRATGSSLVIIDEFGKGTMTEVGLSLLTSSIEHLVNKGKEDCPHLLVSTHFHALLDLLELDHDQITYQTLEVLRRGAILNFQYRLVEGVVNSSFAAFTAAKAGIPQKAVERSNKVYEHLRDGGRLCDIRLEDKKEEERKKLLISHMEEMIEWIKEWRLEDKSMINDNNGDNDIPDIIINIHQRLSQMLPNDNECNDMNEEDDEEEERRKDMIVEVKENHELMDTVGVEENDGERDKTVDDVVVNDEERRNEEIQQRNEEDEEDNTQNIADCTFPWENESPITKNKRDDDDNVLNDVTFPWEIDTQNDTIERDRSKDNESIFILKDKTMNTSTIGKSLDDNIEEEVTGDKSHRTPHESILDISTTSILKGSTGRHERTRDRSNLSVSFSTAVTMMMTEKVEEYIVERPSPKRRKNNYDLFEELIQGSTKGLKCLHKMNEDRNEEKYDETMREEGERNEKEDDEYDRDTSQLTIAVKRLRSH